MALRARPSTQSCSTSTAPSVTSSPASWRSTVAQQLRELHAENHGQEVADKLVGGDDPLEVVRAAALNDAAGATELEAALSAYEVEAVALSEPTPHAVQAVKAMHERTGRLAIVSNNGTAALRAYVEAHRLAGYLGPIIGRELGGVDRMKPDPFLLLTAETALGVEPGRTFLIGDSLTDTQAAQRAGTLSIG